MGDIGHSVRCSIHPQRSSVCREFAPSWEDGTPNPRCDRARVRWGLAPLTPQDWEDPDAPVTPRLPHAA